MKSFLLFLSALLLYVGPVRAEMSSCEAIRTGFHVLSKNITRSLMLPLVNFDFNSSPENLDPEFFHFANAKFAEFRDCESLSKEDQNQILLALSDIDQNWFLSEDHLWRNHPAIRDLAEDVFETSITLLGYFKPDSSWDIFLEDLRAKTRRLKKFRWPTEAEKALSRLQTHFDIGQLEEDANWAQGLTSRMYEGEEQLGHQAMERGAYAILRLAQLSGRSAVDFESSQKDRILIALIEMVDAFYGPIIERDFFIPTKSSRFRLIERHQTRNRFLISQRPNQGVPEGIRSIAYRVGLDLYPVLKKLFPEAAAELVSAQLWSGAFLFNQEEHYPRANHQSGYLTPTVPRSLEKLVNEYLELRPGLASTELMNLAETLMSVEDRWPGLQEEAAKLPGHPLLEAGQRLKEYIGFGYAHFLQNQPSPRLAKADLDENRQKAFESLRREHFRLNALKAENRIQSFIRKMSSCALLMR